MYLANDEIAIIVLRCRQNIYSSAVRSDYYHLDFDARKCQMPHVRCHGLVHTWFWRSQSEVSTDGGGDDNAQYGQANHDHDLLLHSALTDR